MNAQNNIVSRPQLAEVGKQVAPRKPIDIIRTDLDKMKPQFRMMLPQHIPEDRFVRTILTALNQQPELATADRRTLYGSCMRAAGDGLLPDGREGALVIFNTKVKDEDGKDKWIKAIQWMPMVAGIKKKMRQSGELASLTSHAVYAKDTFTYVLGDDESITHIPYDGDDDPGEVRASYAIAKLKDGSICRKVLRKRDIEKMRNVSKSKDGPAWRDWYDQMAEKCAIRRLSKDLPMSTEIEDALRREDTVSVVNSSGKVQDLTVADEFSGEIIEGEATQVEQIDGHQNQQPAVEKSQAKKADTPKPQAKAVETQQQPEPEPDHDPETGEVHDEAPAATHMFDE